MSRRLELTTIARSDLQSIRRYSNRTWGEEQTTRYMTSLRDAMKRLTSGIAISRAREDLRHGLRVTTSGRHCIFFEIDDARVLVIRVLHERMDYQRHLNPVETPPPT